MNNRCYSVLNIKSLDDGDRVIKGIATTPTPDRIGDIIEPMGVKFTNPMPFLWQHKHDQPVGTVSFSNPTETGIEFEAKIAKIDEPGTLKDRIDEAWQSIKAGLVRAVSIGFKANEYSFMDNGGIHFIETEVFELSAVTIPANAEAIITTVKSIDRAICADLGIPEPEIPQNDTLAAIGKKSRIVRLDDTARDRAKPFVIRKIKRA